MGNHQLVGCISHPVDHSELNQCQAQRETAHEPHSISSTSHHHEPRDASCSSGDTTHDTEHIEYAHNYYKRNVKLLFLDVDGVLNHKHLKWTTDNNGIDNKLLSLLKTIVIKTNCKIVLSTTWRLHPRAKQILIHSIKTKLDLNTDDLIIGETPDLKYSGKHRSDEIESYLTHHKHEFHVVSWCAIDDVSLNKYDAHAARFMHNHFVKTSAKIGVSQTNAVRAIDILNSNDFETNSYSYYRAY